MDIQRIQQVEIREVWPHEAYDFTTWLEENIDVLDDGPASLFAGPGSTSSGDGWTFRRRSSRSKHA